MTQFSPCPSRLRLRPRKLLPACMPPADAASLLGLATCYDPYPSAAAVLRPCRKEASKRGARALPEPPPPQGVRRSSPAAAALLAHLMQPEGVGFEVPREPP
jgi:hypothetical protein